MPAKRIYRNQRDKVIGGVCAGIGDYFDVDVAWIRLAFVLAIFFDGLGVIAYLIAWIVFPRDERLPAEVKKDRAVAAESGSSTESGKRWQGVGTNSRNAIGVVLILLGGIFFMDQNFYWFHFDAYWPVILIALGVYLLIQSADREATGAALGTSGLSTATAGSAPVPPATPARPAADVPGEDTSTARPEEGRDA